MGLYDFTVYDLINCNAVSFRNRIAWFEADDDRTLTFSQYKETVDRLASGLQKNSIKKGDRIGVLGKKQSRIFSTVWIGRCNRSRRAAYQLEAFCR